MGRSRNVMVVVAAGLALPALSGCGQDQAAAPPPRDPVIAAVLQEPLMSDPDLVGLSQEGAVFTLAGPASAPVPLIDRSDDEIAAARAGAARVLGSGVQPAPDPSPAMTGAEPGASLAETTARLLGELRRDARCAVPASHSAIWGARLPDAIPIYPRGHLIDGIGNDDPACRLRAVTFLTPVPPRDVADFYWNLAGAAQLSPRHDAAGGGARVVASGAAGAMAAYIATRDEGTEVTLITLGL